MLHFIKTMLVSVFICPLACAYLVMLITQWVNNQLPLIDVILRSITVSIALFLILLLIGM